MRRYLGFLTSLVLSLALAGALFALAPKLSIEDERDSLARASEELADYPFTPLVSELRVFSASWKKWVDEIDTAIKKKKSGGGYADPQKMVESNAAIFRKGKDKVETRLIMVAVATVAGAIVFWLGILMGATLLPKVENLPRVRGRLVLITLAVLVAGFGLPCVVCEDFTGLAFSVPTVVGGVLGWVTRRKSPA